MPVPEGHLWRTRPERLAYCDDCDWRAYSRNAMGLAAQHHIATEHTVRVETCTVHVFEMLDRQRTWREERAEA